jgi:hypothetical protein
VSDADLDLGRLRLATSFGAQRAAAWMTGWGWRKINSNCKAL